MRNDFSMKILTDQQYQTVYDAQLFWISIYDIAKTKCESSMYTSQSGIVD